MSFVLGCFLGIIIGCLLGLFVAAVGTANKKDDFYYEGYTKGYNEKCHGGTTK